MLMRGMRAECRRRRFRRSFLAVLTLLSLFVLEVGPGFSWFASGWKRRLVCAAADYAPLIVFGCERSSAREFPAICNMFWSSIAPEIRCHRRREFYLALVDAEWREPALVSSRTAGRI